MGNLQMTPEDLNQFVIDSTKALAILSGLGSVVFMLAVMIKAAILDYWP